MNFTRFFLYFFCILFLISCSQSYDKLSRNAIEPQDEFSKNLMLAYKIKAEFEAREMHDWNSAKLYSEKALLAMKGLKVFPEDINYWKIPNSKIAELNKAHQNLTIIYSDSIIIAPYNLAKAISSLDCWAEQQEEEWQIWDINECRNDYLIAMHEIYETINKKNSIKNKLSYINDNKAEKITKNKKRKKNIQIVYFDFDKSILTSTNLDEIKKYIKNNKSVSFQVIGHTDTLGSFEYNQNLSLNRAKKVKNILQKLGIKSKNIIIMGRGETDLNVITKDEIAHPLNRRAEISPLN